MYRMQTQLYIHLVWATWDRLPLLDEDLAPGVHRAIGAKCQELGTAVLALGGMPDHVHLLVRLPAALAVAELMRQVKGASSHLATHRLGDGPFFKWQGAYGACSVSPRHLPHVCTYIARQPEHHAAGTLYPALEQPAPTQSA